MDHEERAVTPAESDIRTAHEVVHKPTADGDVSWCFKDDRRQPCDTQVILGILDAERVAASTAAPAAEPRSEELRTHDADCELDPGHRGFCGRDEPSDGTIERYRAAHPRAAAQPGTSEPGLLSMSNPRYRFHSESAEESSTMGAPDAWGCIPLRDALAAAQPRPSEPGLPTPSPEVPPLPWTSPALLQPWPDAAGDIREVRDSHGKPVFARNWREACAAIRYVVMLANRAHRLAAAADSTPPASPHPVLVKYGLESMDGDPLEVLERHLTANAEATIGAWRRLAEGRSASPASEGLRELAYNLDRIHAMPEAPAQGKYDALRLAVERALATTRQTEPAREPGLAARLRAGLPRAVNFRFLPPRLVDDPVWDEIARDLAAALADSDRVDPAPELPGVMEVAGLLSYLWTATGKQPDVAVRDMFASDDPLVADVEGMLARLSPTPSEDRP